MSEETGATACVVASNFVLGDSYMRQGKFQSAQIAFERSNEVAESFGEHNFRPSLLAYMRTNAALAGQSSLDVGGFDEALQLSQDAGDRFSEANVHWKRAQFEAKRADGDVDRMLFDFETAATAFEVMEAKPYTARTLRSWGEELRKLDR